MKRRLDNTADAVPGLRGVKTDQEPAGEMLLHGLGVATDVAGAGRLRRLSDREWDAVIQESARQGMAPLLYHRLQAAGPSAGVPPRVAQRLREIAIGSALKSLRLHHELSDILGVLHREGIAVIVLKGAYLAGAVYGDIALRSMSDVDLMVGKRDLSRIEEKLRGMGYSQRKQPHVVVDYAAHHHLHPLTKPGGVPIEIHWTIQRPIGCFTIDVDELWERARPATIAGGDVLVLSPEDLLLHLCLHTAFDHRLLLGLRACWDIRETIQHHGTEIDWERVQHRAHRWGVGKYVYLMLHLAKELVGAAVPVEALAALRPNGFHPRLITWARAEIFSGQTATVAVSPRLAQMWGTRRVREKALLLAKSVFPSPKAMGRMYPTRRDSRAYLYYPVRWRDLLRQYGRSAWRMVRQDDEVVALVRGEHERAALMDWLDAVSP